jgi:hypothetical protein
VARADDWLALAQVLKRHRPLELERRLDFPLGYNDVIDALVEAGRRAPHDPALGRVLVRLSRFVPDKTGLIDLTLTYEPEERAQYEPEPEFVPPGGFTVSSVLLDL